jgi:hypothetical protein
MKKAILSVGLVAAFVAITASGAAQNTTCRITGKTMDECCCDMKAGKFYCKLTKKTYGECCCDMK